MNPITDDDAVPPPLEPVTAPGAASIFNARVVAIGVMLTLVLVAGLAGAALDRVAHRAGPGPNHGGQGPGPGVSGPGGRRGGPGGGRDGGPRPLEDQLTGDLALTPAQRVAVDSAMAIQLRDFEAARQSIQPRLDSILKMTRTKIEAILTPAQRAALPAFPEGQGTSFGPPMQGPPGEGRRGGPGGRNGRRGPPPQDGRGPPDWRGGPPPNGRGGPPDRRGGPPDRGGGPPQGGGPPGQGGAPPNQGGGLPERN